MLKLTTDCGQVQAYLNDLPSGTMIALDLRDSSSRLRLSIRFCSLLSGFLGMFDHFPQGNPHSYSFSHEPFFMLAFGPSSERFVLLL